MSSAPTIDREALIEEYVRVSALETVISRLGSDVWEPASIDVPWDDVSVYGNLSLSLKEHSHSVLWPQDEDLETREHELAAIRVEMLASRLLLTLVDASEELLRDASHLVGLADENARRLSLKKRED